jgi:hypothetical protein
MEQFESSCSLAHEEPKDEQASSWPPSVRQTAASSRCDIRYIQPGGRFVRIGNHHRPQAQLALTIVLGALALAFLGLTLGALLDLGSGSATESGAVVTGLVLFAVIGTACAFVKHVRHFLSPRPLLRLDEDGLECARGRIRWGDALAEKGLIDAYEVYLNPLVWGEGNVHVLGDRGTVRLELDDVKRFGSGVVLLTYLPAS